VVENAADKGYRMMNLLSSAKQELWSWIQSLKTKKVQKRWKQKTRWTRALAKGRGSEKALGQGEYRPNVHLQDTESEMKVMGAEVRSRFVVESHSIM
jgi:hypothetical protein